MRLSHLKALEAESIQAELALIAKRVDLKGLFAIPVSALAGDNVVTPSTNMPWWTGGTMLAHLETVNVADAYRSSSFRLPVQIVLRPGINYRGFAGQIASGTIQNGDEVVVLPSGRRTRVVGVDLAGEDVTVASAPSSIALRLADDIDISRGERPADPGERRRATRAPRSNRRGRLRARTFRRRSSCAASPSRSFLRADGDTG